jgi:excisionase family DNA binding protein
MYGEKTNKRFLNIIELAEFLGVKPSWIYQRTRQGQSAIPFIRFGGLLRFDLEEVIKFFKLGGN